MASEWPKVTVGDLAESISDTHNLGKDRLVFLNTSDVLLGKVLHHSYSAVREWPGQAKKSIRKGDILFSEIRPANGRWAYVDIDADDYVVSTKLMVIRSHASQVLPRFLYHFLTSADTTRWLQYLAESRSGTFPQITFDQIAELELPLPPLSTQARIVSILDALDDKIELNRRMNETLEAIARAVFKSWFVDFDPVRAKAEGRDPGLPRPLADLFPGRFEDSEFGQTPAGWEVGTLAEYAGLNPESWSKDSYPEMIEYVDLTKAKRGSIESYSTHTRQDAPSRAQRILRPGDTIIGTVRPGNHSYALVADEGLTDSTAFAVLRPRADTYQELIYLAAASPENIEKLSQLADGGAYPAVRPDVVLSTEVIKADGQVLKRFSSVTKPLLARMAQNERESRTLGSLRDRLLPRLISGALRVQTVKGNNTNV